jgi:hypothetical protein
MKTTFKFVSIFLLPVQFLVAQGSYNILGQNLNSPNLIATAVPFLRLFPDARANGMGGVGVATEPDANSAFWNPAKFAFLNDSSQMGFSVSYIPLLRVEIPSINFSYASFYYKLPKNQVLACSFRDLIMNNVLFTDNNGITMGNFDSYEYAFDVTYSRKLSFNWSIGANARYIYSNLTGASAVQGEYVVPGQSVAVDISAYHKGNDSPFFNGDCNVSEGMCISNIGSKISYSNSGVSNFIPTNLRVGAAFNIHFDSYNKLSIMEDANKLLVPTPPVYVYSQAGYLVPINGMNPNVSATQGMIQSFYDAPGGALQEFQEITWSTGIEYTYNDKYSVRTGFFYEVPTQGGREYYSVGAGYRLLTLTVDAAYLMPVSQQSPLYNTLCISFTFNFSPKKKAAHTTA